MQFVMKSALALGMFSPLMMVPAAEAAPFYAKLSVGQTTQTEVSGFALDDGIAYGVSVGMPVGPLRVEAGVSRLSADVPLINAEAHALDYHASAFMDVSIGERASVFAGVGADYVDAQASFFGNEIDASGTGWHWAVGGAYRISERMIGEVQFRQIQADLSSDQIGALDLDASEVSIGFRLAL